MLSWCGESSLASCHQRRVTLREGAEGGRTFPAACRAQSPMSRTLTVPPSLWSRPLARPLQLWHLSCDAALAVPVQCLHQHTAQSSRRPCPVMPWLIILISELEHKLSLPIAERVPS